MYNRGGIRKEEKKSDRKKVGSARIEPLPGLQSRKKK